MKTKEKILVGVVSVFMVTLISIGVYFIFFYKPVPYDLQVDQKQEIIKEKVEETVSTEDIATKKKEKTLEQKEREIESEKTQSKIKIRLLKDASTGKEFTELEDAPLYFAIDGVKYKLQENLEKTTRTEKLMSEDIQRLQGYGYDWFNGYAGKVEPNFKYGEYHEKFLKDTELAIKNLVPQRLDIFKNAVVGWITDPDLVYKMARGDYAVSGVLQLSYLIENNQYNLDPYKLYERDVEFRYEYNTEGLFLNQVVFLSNWKEVEGWENPYK